MRKLALLLILVGAFFIPIAVLSQPNGSSAYQLTFQKIANVISGTNSSSTYLRGDGTWATPSGGSGGSVSLSNITSGTLSTTLALGTQTISSASGGTTWAVNTITLGGVGYSGGFSSNYRWAWGAYNAGAPDNTKAGIFSDGSQVGTNAVSGNTAYFAVAGNVIASVAGSGLSMTNATVNGTLTSPVLTAPSGNVLLKGGAGAAGRVEVADRISVMTAGTAGSYTDPGAGGLYLDGGITSNNNLSVNSGSSVGTNAVFIDNGNGDRSAFGYSFLSNAYSSYAWSIGRSSAATVAWVDGAGAGNLTTNAPTGSSQQFRINNVEQAVINGTGSYMGVASPATTATVGFPNIPVCAGAPTGTPTLRTGFAPMVYDTTNHKLWIYDGGAWRGALHS